MKRMRCDIVISRADRRKHKQMAGKIAVGLVTLETMGHEVATWYLVSNGVPLDTVLRVMTMPEKRRR